MYPKACGYTLFRDCSTVSSRYSIRVQNEDCLSNEHVQYCKKQNLFATWNGQSIEIRRTISGDPETVSLELHVNGLQITEHFQDNGLRADFVGASLILKFDSFDLVCSGQNFYLTVSEDLEGKTCGLCGTYNKNSQDDFSDANNGGASNAGYFLQAWLNPQDQPSCKAIAKLGEEEPTHSMDYCGLYSQNEDLSLARASWIKKEDGPFQNCMGTLSPHPFFDRAKKSGCRHSESLCYVAAGYAKACGDKGVIVGNWRKLIPGCAERKYC